jgi:hypothetical protein
MKRIRILYGVGDIGAGFETDNFAYFKHPVDGNEYAVIYGPTGSPWYFSNTKVPDYKSFELFELSEDAAPKIAPSIRSLLGQDVATLTINFK